MKQYAQEGQFAPGSMLPKVEARLSLLNLSQVENIDYVIRKAKEGLSGKQGL